MMTEDRDLKKQIRVRAQRTGESYQAARRQLPGMLASANFAAAGRRTCGEGLLRGLVAPRCTVAGDWRPLATFFRGGAGDGDAGRVPSSIRARKSVESVWASSTMRPTMTPSVCSVTRWVTRSLESVSLRCTPCPVSTAGRANCVSRTSSLTWCGRYSRTRAQRCGIERSKLSVASRPLTPGSGRPFGKRQERRGRARSADRSRRRGG